MSETLRVKLLRPGAKLPVRGSAQSAGYDLHCLLENGDVTIAPGESAILPTGIAVAMPNDHTVGLIYARSGLGIRHGVVPTNCVGVIDADYRGEIHIALRNHAQKPYTVQNGDRVAQMVITPYLAPEVHAVGSLDDTERGSGGFGSTGFGALGEG